jgi:hypothetical protein
MRRLTVAGLGALVAMAAACGPSGSTSPSGVYPDAGPADHSVSWQQDAPAAGDDASVAGADAPPTVTIDGGADDAPVVASDDASGVGDDAPIGTGSDAGPPVTRVMYANTDTVLFQADPTATPITLTQIGTFDCVGGSGQDPAMTDIAVDRNNNLFGISQTGAYPLQINGTTVHCVAKWTLPSSARFYGLTFAPAGVLGAQELLVAANSNGELWAIDSTGATTQVGIFGTVPANDGQGHTYASANVGKTWELSGDIVFLANHGSPLGFATVRDCPSPPSTSNCNSVDTLIEIDLTALHLGNTGSVTKAVRGQVVKAAGCTDAVNTGYGSMYGIAAWADKVYGFSRAGNLVEISNVDGTACLLQAYASDKFAGAGVTTAAEVISPG